MRTVGIKTLKDHLSEYVRIAASGETVLISDRDHVVAEMGPPQGGRAPIVADAVISRLIQEGLVTPAQHRGPVPPAPEAGRMPLAELLAQLDDDRADR